MRYRCMQALVAATLLAGAVVPVMATSAQAAAPTDDYMPLAPSRIYDSTDHGVLRPGHQRAVPVTGEDVPLTGASAVDLTVTAAGRTQAGTLSIEPCGTPQARVTVLRFAESQAISNHVNAPFAANGTVCVRTSTPADFQLDLDGYYPLESGYHAIHPKNVLAQRTLGVGGQVGFKVAGGTVPQSTTAVAFEVIASFASNPGRIVLWPCGKTRPAVTAMSYPKRVKRIGFALSPVGAGGRVCAWASHTTDLAVQAVGYYASDTSLHAVSGAKLAGKKVAANAVTHVKVTGRGSHVAVDARAVQLAVETSDQHAPGRLTLYACGHQKPKTTVETFAKGDAIDDIAVSSVGIGGQVCIVSSKPATLIVRLVGWYDNGTA